jgi:uncharacterized protein (TIGR00375 family)
MRFIADLHIHSHYSISTSPQLTPEHLEAWAGIKGITVLGTGDFTHPGWLEELKDKLEPAEEGLFRLKRAYRLDAEEARLPLIGMKQQGQELRPVRFLLTAEISNIYRRADQVRKVHNLILVPTFEAAEKIQSKLSRFANITSDGRPILGLDSRALLEIALESSDQMFFAPAHIWTPWFSALGAKSGFDSIAECYGELAEHIRAVETGLSSDPPMNWLCSFLDGYTLISNSDAHSPEKLGREANLLDTDLSYPGIIAALSARQSPLQESDFLGTVEFFPQEGKYHYDGHRKCGICWDPLETLRHRSICPVCGRPVTVGVLNRVAQLADRAQTPDANSHPRFRSLIPLKEIFSEITGVGVQSKKIAHLYSSAIQTVGSEFALLLDTPIEDIEIKTNELLAEAIRRMRCGQVLVEPGFDGQFGRVKLFSEAELSNFSPQELLFQDMRRTESESPTRNGLINFDITTYRRLAEQTRQSAPEVPPTAPNTADVEPSEPTLLSALNPKQREAVSHGAGPLLILAGPGTGKTRTLTARIAYLIESRGIEPHNILALTFTNKAAGEMQSRVQSLLSAPRGLEEIHLYTFHALGLSILKTHAGCTGRNSEFSLIDENDRLAVVRSLPGVAKDRVRSVCDEISSLKSTVMTRDEISDPEMQRVFELYEEYLRRQSLFDLDDLIQKPVSIFLAKDEVLAEYRRLFQWILVDEYQDINLAQYRLIRLLAPEGHSNLFAIGDPNQAIYGFRGADVGFINQFLSDYPTATLFNLSRSYRCSDTILQASHQVLAGLSSTPTLRGLEPGVRLRILENPTGKSEAEVVARTIEAMMGGLRFFSMDSDISEGSSTEGIQSLADFAVLCRIGRQMDVLERAFQNHSIPYQKVGETPFFRQEPVKSVIDILRLAAKENPVLRKSVMEKDLIGAEKLEELRESTDRADSTANLVSTVLACTDLELSPEQHRSLFELAESFGTESGKFLEYVVLGSAPDSLKPASEQVALMTLHAAKGLEFPCVFILGCEQGLLPYSLAGHNVADPEEERRLFYVGMTRAKRYLFLSYAGRRYLFGREHRLAKSSFLAPIEEGLLELERARPRTQRSTAASAQKQLDLF